MAWVAFTLAIFARLTFVAFNFGATADTITAPTELVIFAANAFAWICDTLSFLTDLFIGTAFVVAIVSDTVAAFTDHTAGTFNRVTGVLALAIFADSSCGATDAEARIIFTFACGVIAEASFPTLGLFTEIGFALTLFAYFSCIASHGLAEVGDTRAFDAFFTILALHSDARSYAVTVFAVGIACAVHRCTRIFNTGTFLTDLSVFTSEVVAVVGDTSAFFADLTTFTLLRFTEIDTAAFFAGEVAWTLRDFAGIVSTFS